MLRYEEDLKLYWEEYLKTLINVENEREETDMINKTEGPEHYVTREGVKMVLSKMSNGKACGPLEVRAELLKCLGEYGIDLLHDIIKDVWNRGNLSRNKADGTFNEGH